MPKSPKKRKKAEKRFVSGLFKLLLSLLLIFGFLFVASRTFGGVALSGFTDAFAEFSESFSGGKKFPYALTESSRGRYDMMGNGLIVYDTKGTKVLNKSAGTLLETASGYASPFGDIRNGRAVVFDRNGTKFSLISRSRLLYEKKTKAGILDAAVSENGYTAVATLGKDVTSVLTVYDRHMREYFKWNCAKDYISDIALSDDGKTVVAAVMGVKSAELVSKVIVFDTDETKPKASFEFDGVTVVDVDYTSRRVITVLGDNLRSIIKDKTKRIDGDSFESDTLRCYDSTESGKSAIVLMTYGNEELSKLKVFSKNGQKKFETDIEGKVTDVSCSEAYTVLLIGKKAVIYNNSGTDMGSISFSEIPLEVKNTNSKLYVRFADRIEQYSVSSRTK
ncbi:MAG: DUF5711 family protein [Clostridiales bacterium]|nr:DUF5711 family protein [Clostridiales bacterium]